MNSNSQDIQSPLDDLLLILFTLAFLTIASRGARKVAPLKRSVSFVRRRSGISLFINSVER